MATTETLRSFSNTLNEFIPTGLLVEDMVKKNWFLSNVEMINDWDGGNLIVAFRSGRASSVQFGNLPGETDIAEQTNVRGTVSGYKELWGSLIFNDRDIVEHSKLSRQNLLRILPDMLDDFTDYMEEVTSLNTFNGSQLAALTADGDASGNLTVDRHDRFTLKQKVIANNAAGGAAVTGYVQSINVETKVVQCDTTRAGGTPADFSTVLLASSGKVYHPGADPDADNSFSSLRKSVLSAANGGDTTIYGVTKTAQPYTQSINVNGGAGGLAITATNIMEGIFDAITEVRLFAKGKPNKVVMSYKNFGSVLKVIENSKGAFTLQSMKSASQFGWDEITIGAVARGPLTIVAVHEMDDDLIYLLDMRGIKLYTNGGFRRRVGPDGQDFHPIRSASGYKYIADWSLFGEVVVDRPSYQGVIHSISY